MEISDFTWQHQNYARPYIYEVTLEFIDLSNISFFKRMIEKTMSTHLHILVNRCLRKKNTYILVH